MLGVDPWAAREFAPDDYVLREGAYRDVTEERDLFAGMLAGLDAKRELSTTLLQEGDWDLFITVFGEGHTTGHQQWHLHDPSTRASTRPRERPSAAIRSRPSTAGSTRQSPSTSRRRGPTPTCSSC